MYVTTFRNKRCDTIRVEYYKQMSNATPSKTIEASHADVVADLLAIINRLPDTGAKMKKLGDVEHIQVVLVVNHVDKEHFSVYNGKVKTPSTSFYDTEVKEEALLYQALKNLLR